MLTTFHIKHLLKCCTLLIGLWTSLPAASFDSLTLIAVPPVNAPEIAQKRIKITVNLLFDHTPPEYWIYYKKETGRLVCEFFGIHVRDTNFTLRGTDVLRFPTITNGTTELALNKKSGSISFEMDQGWHYESWIMPGKVLKLQIWMPLDPSRRLNSKKNKVSTRAISPEKPKYRRHQQGTSAPLAK